MKQLPISGEVERKLRASFGPDADLTNLAVFEVTAVTDLPIRQRGGLFQGARVGESTMLEMAAHLEKESVPLIVNHTTDGEPHGRTFAGKVQDGSLHALIALNSKVNADSIERLNSGVTDQVSVAILSKKCLCSECGFDYFGEEADFENIYLRTCPEGHEIGVDGVHTRLLGLASFYELSLVGQGASPGARVKGPSEAILAKSDGFQRLAAKNAHPSMVVLQASPTLPEPETMSLDKDFLAQFSAQAGELGASKAEVARLTAELAVRPSADVAALQTQVADLTPKAALAVELQTKLDEAIAALAAAPKAEDVTVAVTALKAHAKAVLVACGEANPEALLSDDVAALDALIKEKTAKLTAIIPIGARSVVTEDDKSKTKPAASNAAFQSRQ